MLDALLATTPKMLYSPSLRPQGNKYSGRGSTADRSARAIGTRGNCLTIFFNDVLKFCEQSPREHAMELCQN